MELADRTIVVTGGTSGIGRAMVERFAKEGPRGIAVVGRNTEAAVAIAEQVGGLAITADLTSEAEVKRVIAETEARFGPIDLFCSNAGLGGPGDLETPDEEWLRNWNINVMAHVWAARALVPVMAARGEGYLLNTASAGGLLMATGAVPYTVTKHAAVALAESLSVLYRSSGVHFSCLCPGLVETPMVAAADGHPAGLALRIAGRTLQPETVADVVVEGLRREQFLILSHPENQEMAVGRAADPEAYLKSASDLWSAVTETTA
jgi:NAD(P)-dependent dehydrogenase (short-subunit alcohol dehydrogenase family)